MAKRVFGLIPTVFTVRTAAEILTFFQTYHLHAYVSPAIPPVVHCVYVLSDELGLIACSRVHFGITLKVDLGGSDLTIFVTKNRKMTSIQKFHQFRNSNFFFISE